MTKYYRHYTGSMLIYGVLARDDGANAVFVERCAVGEGGYSEACRRREHPLSPRELADLKPLTASNLDGNDGYAGFEPGPHGSVTWEGAA